MSTPTTSDYLSELFLRIKSSRQNLNKTILKDELTKWMFDTNCDNYYITFNNYDNFSLSVLYGEQSDSKYLNNVGNYCNFIVLRQYNFEPIVSYFNKTIYDLNALKILKNINENNWKNLEITKFHLNSIHVCLFYENNNWFLGYSKKIELFIVNNSKIGTFFLDFITSTNSHVSNGMAIFNTDHVYHFLIKNCDFDNLKIHFGQKTQQESGITLLWVCNKMCELVTDHVTELFSINIEKKIYFSCLDELEISLEMMNKEDIASKNIQFGGYFIRILSEDKKRYMLLCLRTEIYNNILSVLPKHDNQYKSFLELYQCDKLTEVLPYLHKYPADVIRRINMSVRILSKEILNIYHLTRKKQNCELYESLSFSYRKVLYDLHQIYVNQKNIDFHVKSHDILKEKKSISVDIVYMYLKELKNSDLIKIFEERNKLINELKKINFHYEEILSVTNIDIITQTELMFS
jgi:hypothetical protein